MSRAAQITRIYNELRALGHGPRYAWAMAVRG